jgi:hypothetical protein
VDLGGAAGGRAGLAAEPALELVAAAGPGALALASFRLAADAPPYDIEDALWQAGLLAVWGGLHLRRHGLARAHRRRNQGARPGPHHHRPADRPGHADGAVAAGAGRAQT